MAMPREHKAFCSLARLQSEFRLRISRFALHTRKILAQFRKSYIHTCVPNLKRKTFSSLRARLLYIYNKSTCTHTKTFFLYLLIIYYTTLKTQDYFYLSFIPIRSGFLFLIEAAMYWVLQLMKISADIFKIAAQ